MEGQKKPEYYLADGTLFAHGDYYDFFRTYNKKSGQWETCRVSFSRFLHDFWYTEISEAQAKEITGGNLPLDDYKEYCERLSDR